MTDIEWWQEFGTCTCDACLESTEIQSMRAVILNRIPDIDEQAETVNNKPSLF